jgi:hypothetical protein
MTESRKLLLETLVGHFALLASAHPRKANTQTAKRAMKYVQTTLRATQPRRRAA